MKRPSKRSIATAVLLLSPFLINLFGWNLFTYTHIGEDDLVIGVSQGLSHNAISEHFIDGDPATALFPEIEELQKELEEMRREFISTDRFKVFAERRMDPMQFNVLNIIESSEYSDYDGFEFSWIFVPILPLLASSLKRKQSRQPDGGHNSGSSAASIVPHLSVRRKMKFAVTVLAIATIVFGILAIEKNRTEIQKLRMATGSTKIPNESHIVETDEINQRYFSLLEEYKTLHGRMVEQYNQTYEEELEFRRRIRFTHPALELPLVEDQRLMFYGITSIETEPSTLDISKLESEIERLKRILPNQSVHSTTYSRSAPSGRE